MRPSVVRALATGSTLAELDDAIAAIKRADARDGGTAPDVAAHLTELLLARRVRRRMEDGALPSEAMREVFGSVRDTVAERE